MGSASITRNGIDMAVAGLKYKNNSVKSRFISAMLKYYHNGDDFESLNSIDTDELIKNIWDTSDDISAIKSKRRNFHSIRSSIISDLESLNESENPEKITITSENIFDMTEEAKSSILSSFSQAAKSSSLDLGQIADVISSINELIAKMELDTVSGSDTLSQIKEKLKSLSDNIAPENLESETVQNSADEEIVEVDGDEEIEELSDDEEIVEVDGDEEIEELSDDEEIVEIEGDEEIEELSDDEEIVEVDGDEEIEELSDDEEIVEVDGDAEIEELGEDEEIVEVDGDEEIEELGEDEEIVDVDVDEEIEELGEDEEIEELEEIGEDNEIIDVEDEEIEELGEDEELVDEDDMFEDAGEIPEDEDLFEEVELDDQDLMLDDSEFEEFREFQKNRELAKQFDQLLSDADKKYNIYVVVPSGTYTVGSLNASRNRLELQQIEMEKLYIARYPVTNSLFEIFILETGYVTTAEKKGYGTVFSGRFRKNRKASTWRQGSQSSDVRDACWYQPEGPGSSLHNKKNHPVVQVSVDDAFAFSSWIGRRLPSEAEWEAAARTDMGYKYPWGNEWKADACNVEASLISDTTPVDRFEAYSNLFSIADMLGNVMEWTKDQLPNPFMPEKRELYNVAKGCGWVGRGDSSIGSRSLFRPQYTSNVIGFRCISEYLL